MDYGFDSERAAGFPPMVVVSIVNKCNLKCVHCHYPTFAKQPEYKAREMEWEVWTKICDEMAEHPESMLNLGTDGEPMIHRRFVDMMRHARKAGTGLINMTCNGTLLKGAKADAILDEELIDVVNVSLDAFTEETYKEIRGGKLSIVTGLLHDFLDKRAQKNSNVKVQVNIIDQPEAEAELAEFVDFWDSLVDNVMVRRYYGATHVTGAPGADITGKEKPWEEVERWPCQQFWRRLNISEEGLVRFCVDDWYNKSKIGDVRESSLVELWTQVEYERLRKLQLESRFDEIPYCKDCTEWQGMQWDYDYFTAMEKMMGRSML